MVNNTNTDIRFLLRRDTFIQGILILFILITGGIGIVIDAGFGLLAGIAMLFLGLQQVVSAIVFSLVLRDTKKRGLYLLSVIGLLISCYFMSILIPYFDIDLKDWAPQFTFMIIAVLALHYFTITFRDMAIWSSEYLKAKEQDTP